MAGAVGGLMALPAWASNWTPDSVCATRPFLSLSQTDLLGGMVEAIIPKTDTPGARDLNVHLFVQKMVADCYPAATQETLKKGLDGLDSQAQKLFSKSFSEGDATQQTALLTQSAQDAAQKDFYGLVKSLTIRGYLSSEYVMTNLTHYQFIPGHYYGCVPAKE